ncbi:hypothetical protein ACM66B_005589 [Microbotryomycetes sp. NB124-2]
MAAVSGPTFTDVDLTDTYADDHSSFTSSRHHHHQHDHPSQEGVRVDDDDEAQHATELDQSTLLRQRATRTSYDLSGDTSRLSLDDSIAYTRRDSRGLDGRQGAGDVGIDRLMAFVDDNMPFSTSQAAHIHGQGVEAANQSARSRQEQDLLHQVEDRRRRDDEDAQWQTRRWPETIQRHERHGVSQAAPPRAEHQDDEALQEFSQIVSQRASPVSQHGRPRSRLRDLAPTPTLDRSESHATRAETSHHEHAPYVRDDATQYTEDLTKTSQFSETDLVDELQHARSYISHLQDELRSINDVVNRMRLARESSPQARAQPSSVPASEQAPPRLSGDSTKSVDPNEAVLTVAKHVLALVPDIQTLPSIESLAMALELTRRIDCLVASETRDVGERRRDEDIFTRANVDGLVKVVERWAQAQTSARDHVAQPLLGVVGATLLSNAASRTRRKSNVVEVKPWLPPELVTRILKEDEDGLMPRSWGKYRMLCDVERAGPELVALVRPLKYKSINLAGASREELLFFKNHVLHVAAPHVKTFRYHSDYYSNPTGRTRFRRKHTDRLSDVIESLLRSYDKDEQEFGFQLWKSEYATLLKHILFNLPNVTGLDMQLPRVDDSDPFEHPRQHSQVVPTVVATTTLIYRTDKIEYVAAFQQVGNSAPEYLVKAVGQHALTCVPRAVMHEKAPLVALQWGEANIMKVTSEQAAQPPEDGDAR